MDKPVILLMNDDVRTLETLNRLAGQSGEVALPVAVQARAGTTRVEFLSRAQRAAPRPRWRPCGPAYAHRPDLTRLDITH